MATPSERLADSLNELKKLQDGEKIAIKATELSRTHLERLVKNGFLRKVTSGWYIIKSPNEGLGDSTSWYNNFWIFCSRFLNERYKENWSISAEQSIQLHAGNWNVPQQLIIKSPESNNFKIVFPFNTTLFSMRSELPVKEETTVTDGIRMLTLPAALIHCSANTYTQNATDVRTALSMITGSSELLNSLLEGGNSVVAGRLAGAFRNNGQQRIADEILKTMKAAGYDVRESDPFARKLEVTLSTHTKTPYTNRLKLMWQEMRNPIIEIFPKAPGIPENKKAYLKKVEEIYVTDAYHSLSIEKYKVTPELIERVRKGAWNHSENPEDKQQRDAMAARGYWQAFQIVEKSISKILNGANSGDVLDTDHGDWYRELFSPSVTAGLLRPADLAGYRNHQVYIAGSRHVPLNKEAVRETMPALFELLKEEPEASVRSVLGHFIFVFIHPYMDGNGRMGRFMMNTMLASGGFPWTVIPVDDRISYMTSLESASVGQDIKPFANFLAKLVQESIEGNPIAKLKRI